MIRLFIGLALMLAFSPPAFAKEVTDRRSCLSYFSDAIQISDSYEFAARYHAKLLKDAPEASASYAAKIVALHGDIAKIYIQIASEADLMCRTFD
jgi:hypothetical protein